MSLRHHVALLCLALLGLGPTGVSFIVEGATPGTTTGPATIRLRTSSTVSFSQARWFAWVPPTPCGDDGDVFFLVVPEASPRDARNPKIPSDILGVSADGKKTTLFQPAAVPAFADADQVRTIATALDTSGTLLALVWAPRGEAGSQYIVSFDKTGHYRSHFEIDQQEMIVQKFEVFGSGEFLLHGVHQQPDGDLVPRVAVLSAGGGSLRDVIGLPLEEWKDPATTPAKSLIDHVVRGGDGRIYFVQGGEDSINVIDASGNSEQAFKLAPMPRNRRLVELKAAGQRLAATYYEEGPNDKSGRHWIAVYDVVLGERLVVYGPAPGVPVCYQYNGRQDRFTLFKDGHNLVTASP